MAAELNERVGQRLRERREELGLSRPEVARRMSGKVSENQIYRWEKAKHLPQSDTFEELAAVLGKDASYFMVPDPASNLASPLDALGEPNQLARIELKLDLLLARTKPTATGAVQAQDDAALQRLEDLVRTLQVERPPQTRRAPGALGGSGK